MFGNTLLILPFGLLPFVFFIVWMLYFRGADSAQKHVGSKIRKGVTEFPLELSACLVGSNNQDELEFTSDGRSILWTIRSHYNPITASSTFMPSHTDVKSYIHELLKNKSSDGIDLSWVDHYQIGSIEYLKETGGARITVSIDDKTVRSESYIAHEITNLGRVFLANSTTNKYRWLSHLHNDNRVEMEDGRLMVYVSRAQSVPGFLDGSKDVVMSEKQITRNIQNRLWNRVNVRCISMKDDLYCGEILPA